jgi:succinate dehydrogenase / fumarate reductase cytochrome b subunit
VSDTAAASSKSLGFLERHHFLLRRLHSLSGIVPVGIFVCFHLFTNFQILAGDIQHEVQFIHSLPALITVEMSLWLGIGFHAALGFVYTFTGQSNVKQYKYEGNWRYTLQRVTGIIALIFIFLHIATLRWRWDIFGWFTPFFVAGPDGTPLVAATTAHALQSSVIVLIFYIVGVFSVVYHWANGLWTAAISWGLTITPAAQRRWSYVCAALGLFLAIFAGGAIFGSLTYPISPEEKAAIADSIKLWNEKGEIVHEASSHGTLEIQVVGPEALETADAPAVNAPAAPAAPATPTH